MQHGVEGLRGLAGIDGHHHVRVRPFPDRGMADDRAEGAILVRVDHDPTLLRRDHFLHHHRAVDDGLILHLHHGHRRGLFHGRLFFLGRGLCSHLLARSRHRQSRQVRVGLDELRSHPAGGLHVRHLDLEPGAIAVAAQDGHFRALPQAGHHLGVGAGALPHPQGAGCDHTFGAHGRFTGHGFAFLGLPGLAGFLLGHGRFLLLQGLGGGHHRWIGRPRGDRRQEQGDVTLKRIAASKNEKRQDKACSHKKR